MHAHYCVSPSFQLRGLRMDGWCTGVITSVLVMIQPRVGYVTPSETALSPCREQTHFPPVIPAHTYQASLDVLKMSSADPRRAVRSRKLGALSLADSPEGRRIPRGNVEQAFPAPVRPGYHGPGSFGKHAHFGCTASAGLWEDCGMRFAPSLRIVTPEVTWQGVHLTMTMLRPADMAEV